MYNTNFGQTSVINMLAVRPAYIFMYNTNSGQTSVTNIWAVTEGRGECSQMPGPYICQQEWLIQQATPTLHRHHTLLVHKYTICQ